MIDSYREICRDMQRYAEVAILIIITQIYRYITIQCKNIFTYTLQYL